ncbi:diphosphate--fructose-6-phosphate 1-phosphotransferase [Mycobacterium sp.]|jgi:hypothetical protein|uniref:diphosphate--fructose-6-phosphate 1-phosphotransferase n=1 Tax=Mycobacterium sp. TaxID=1785 RepID=UPI002D3EEE44|nr:diphosphate--fructose-6-phosphate 1-phosphotransferase [Mycobacterium sp.]HZA09132.1 diphosphate--fructose-6-phosphate 1-phosphotransferase [Mycobacterium sp.]
MTSGAVSVGDAVKTYRYLRLGLFALVAFLFASIVETWISEKCLQGSISAYFYTTTHAVFIASLCAIGICLIVYQGSTPTENALLDFSGFLAFIVALVPIKNNSTCGAGLPTNGDWNGAVDNNVRALLIAVAIGIGTYWTIKILQPLKSSEPLGEPSGITPAEPPPGGVSGFLRWGLPTLLLVFLITGVVIFFACPDQFKASAHGVAASVMFVAFILVAVHYAYYAAKGMHPRRSSPQVAMRFAGIYAALAVIMVVTLLAAIVLHFAGHPSHLRFFAEALLSVEFAIFWIVQTCDMWDIDTYPPTR